MRFDEGPQRVLAVLHVSGLLECKLLGRLRATCVTPAASFSSEQNEY